MDRSSLQREENIIIAFGRCQYNFFTGTDTIHIYVFLFGSESLMSTVNA
jgi:hypothetical protein